MNLETTIKKVGKKVFKEGDIVKIMHSHLPDYEHRLNLQYKIGKIYKNKGLKTNFIFDLMDLKTDIRIGSWCADEIRKINET